MRHALSGIETEPDQKSEERETRDEEPNAVMRRGDWKSTNDEQDEPVSDQENSDRLGFPFSCDSDQAEGEEEEEPYGDRYRSPEKRIPEGERIVAVVHDSQDLGRDRELLSGEIHLVKLAESVDRIKPKRWIQGVKNGQRDRDSHEQG